MVEKQLLCRLEEIPEGSSRGFSAQADAPYADILVVRLGERVGQSHQPRFS